MSNASEEPELPSSVTAFIESLYRDPRYVLIGKHVRNGIERIAFAEACTVVSAGGEVRGQLLLDGEYMPLGRPDGERPFGEDSLVDYYLGSQATAGRHLGEEDFAGLREESWQHYVRRNFCFQLGDFAQARDDAQHNLAIWNLIEQSDVSDEDKWSYLKWWPWLERDRSIAQALWDLIHDEPEHAATELYRALRSIEQFGISRAGQYDEEEGDGEPMCETMRQHIEALTEMLRQDADLPVSVEEQLDRAEARGDQEEVARLRAHLIRQATEG
jgi:hypothetical protein